MLQKIEKNTILAQCRAPIDLKKKFLMPSNISAFAENYGAMREHRILADPDETWFN